MMPSGVVNAVSGLLSASRGTVEKASLMSHLEKIKELQTSLSNSCGLTIVLMLNAVVVEHSFLLCDHEIVESTFPFLQD